MITIALSRTSIAAPPAAWFIAGGDPAAWLDEICAWHSTTSSLRCLVIPRGRGDRSAEGLLVIGGGALPLPASARAIAYARIGNRLYLPIDAALDPPLSGSEADAAVPYAAAVFHPAVGFVGFVESDLLRCSDLVRAPERGPLRWTSAVPGVSDDLRLQALLPVNVQSAEEVIQQAADDIGSQPPTALPNDGMDIKPVSSLARWLRLRLANAIDRLADLAPRTASKPTWINRAQDWAQGLARKDRAYLDDIRHQEIARLLRAFDEDPDLALRFAIPLAGDPHRGLAPAGAHLGPRNTDFNLGRLGGGPADPWDMSERMRLSLAERYRQQAQREVALGRHRRAAYVHAHLLGDFAAAAQCLEQGGHFREAAAIHRDRLGNPRGAASCLERGGLLHEAIAMWVDLGEHERAGDNYQELGDRAAAVASWRRSVDAAVARQDALAAAKLLDGKVTDVEGALSLLASTWPDHVQSALCLTMRFGILGRVGRHQEARSMMREIAEGAAPDRRSAVLSSLITVAGRYPEESTRDLARDAGRLLVSAALADGGGKDMLPRLAELEPSDKLLARDAARYSDRRTRAPRPPSSAAPSPSMQVVRLLCSLPRHPDALYVGAVARRQAIIAASFAPDGFRLTETTWSGGPGRFLQWPGIHRAPVTMLAGSGMRAHLMMTGQVLPYQCAAPDDRHGDELAANSYPSEDELLLAIGPASDGMIWKLYWHEGRSLLSLDTFGVAYNRQYAGPAIDLTRPMLVHHLGPLPLVANDSTLTLVQLAGKCVSTDLGSTIRQIARHPDHPDWIVVALPLGVAALQHVADGWKRRNAADSVGRPVIGFTGDGLLVVASGKSGRHYQLEADGLHPIGSEWDLSTQVPSDASSIVAVVEGPTLSQAAILFDSGAIVLIEKPTN